MHCGPTIDETNLSAANSAVKDGATVVRLPALGPADIIVLEH
jgi:hypothetical protein